MKKYLIVILSEMCNRVNVKFKDIDFKKERWFMEYSWTIEEEKNFTNWVEEYLTNNKEARKEIMEYPHKRNIKKAVQFFVMNYGWTTKNK